MPFSITKYAPIIEQARTSFWFVPSFMVLSSILLAGLAIYIDAVYIDSIKHSLPLIYQLDIDAIRSLLATIAGAMITVTSIAFSITIVALTLASSQFGPRLLRNFMMDSGTQVVLGSFISNFLFCILAFCAISFQQLYTLKPGIMVVIAVLMTCFSVGVLIYFIHHVAKSIQADVVIDDVYQELQCGIEQLFPSVNQQHEAVSNAESIENGLTQRAHQINVLASFSGYIQTVDRKALITLATDSDVLVECLYGPGDFVVQNAVIATIYSDNLVDNKVTDLASIQIVLGAYRTPVQDPEFAIHQLVEIALRALSPGINDPYSAITCIDKLTSVLCELTTKVFPEKQHYDQAGILRLVCKVLSFKNIAKAAFDQIRQQANSNVAVTIRLLESLQVLMTFVQTNEQKHFVKSQTKMIEEQQSKQPLSKDDSSAINSKVALILNSPVNKSV
ncbi:DUF2254 domain-containing protein [Paraglaciecola aquimarina]|uniref:DUF2254 domain-containing protein n=1 Tax=Paraglaciecola algarum TaxID=3050085 RepID=A0ABS9DA63_9ALTE|nr:DUF2254 domain-containing protein [Paraglaciecola sp. G1-23]MCF2949705.1 DUF2254 domain-containing protein [Paraglaciecola sp. G1-23]